MLNNESFPFRGIRVYDPDVVGWRAERAESFTLTFQTLVGEILFPLGEPLWQELLGWLYVQLGCLFSTDSMILGQSLIFPHLFFKQPWRFEVSTFRI